MLGVPQAWAQRSHVWSVRSVAAMRLFMAKKTKRQPPKKGKTESVKRENKNNTQRRHPAKIGAPFGRPAK